MKIYVVTQGDYSDYHIIAATHDENLAKQIAEKFSRSHYSEAEVEEYEDAAMMLKPCWFIQFQKNGAVLRISDASDSDYAYHGVGKCRSDNAGRVHLYVVADDPNSAIKIAAEKRAEFLAKEEGII